MTPAGPKQIIPVALLNVASRSPVVAELWKPITEKNLADWEVLWAPETAGQLKVLHQAGIERRLWPQSRKWDWRQKQEAFRGRLDNQSYAVMQGGETQAMMIVDLSARARLDEQVRQHLVYIDFLEAAPWNRRTLTGGQPRFAGAGSILLGAAIELSLEQGFKGRIGLHSLPQSNDFYANACGMCDLGADENYSNLRYFEMTPEIAAKFLKKGA